MERERGVAADVSRARSQPSKIRLPFSVTGRIARAGWTREEFNRERLSRCRIERARYSLRWPGHLRTRNHREVLQAVRAVVRILIVVWRHAVRGRIPRN